MSYESLAIIILQIAIIPAGGWVVNRLFGRLDTIGDWLQTLNDAVGKLQEWRAGHEKIDDNRHTENLGKFNEITEQLKELTRVMPIADSNARLILDALKVYAKKR